MSSHKFHYFNVLGGYNYFASRIYLWNHHSVFLISWTKQYFLSRHMVVVRTIQWVYSKIHVFENFVINPRLCYCSNPLLWELALLLTVLVWISSGKVWRCPGQEMLATLRKGGVNKCCQITIEIKLEVFSPLGDGVMSLNSKWEWSDNHMAC